MRRAPALVLGLLLSAGAAPLLAGDPASLVSRRAQAYNLFLRAQTLLMLRQDAVAADLLDRAAERDPAPDLLIEAARASTTVGRFDRAAAYIERVLAARPGWAPALAQRGDLHLERARAGEDAAVNVEAALEDYRAAALAEPGDVETTRALAELCVQTGRFDEAVEHLETLAARRALPANLGLLLARLHIRAGRVPEARTLLEGLVRRAPTSFEAADVLARLYEGEGRLDEAIALYAPLLESGTAAVVVRQRLGALLLEAGRTGEALERLSEAQVLDPEAPAILLLLIQAQERAGDPVAAAATCDRLLAADPANLEGLFHRARMLRQRGDADAARAGYEDLLRRAAERTDLDDREEAIVTLAWGQAGLLAFAARDWRAAADRLGTAVARAPEPPADLVRLRIRALVEAGDRDGAEAAIASAIDDTPGDRELLALRCEIIAVGGDPAGARTCGRAIIEGAGGAPDAFLAVSRALMRRRDFAGAEAILAEAAGRHPGDDAILFEHGAALERLGRRGEAERLLALAIERNPDNAMALNYLGYMLADSGRRLRDSLTYAERAVALDPDNPAFLDSLGWALFKLERYATAEEKMRAALRYDATDPVLREHLGDLLIATGRPEEAVREWQAALQYGHEDPARIREKLDRVLSAEAARR